MQSLAQQVRPEDALEPHQARSWLDLATLALMAEAHELRTQGEQGALDQDSRGRLRELNGERLDHYWEDLLYHGQVLGVLARDQARWVVKNKDAEILGATRREVFPALCAVWLKHPAPLASLERLHLLGPQNTLLRLEVLRLLGLFEPERWYPYESFALMLRLAAHRHQHSLEHEQAHQAGAILLERVFLAMGALDLDERRQHFRLHAGLQLPPLPPEAAAFDTRACRAEAYRKVISEKLQKSQAWRHVASGLMRCMEVRRGREPMPESLRCLDTKGDKLQTDPRLPFRDCLFLANLGHLLPQSADPGGNNAPGSYIFQIDRERVQRMLHNKGLCPEQLSGFLQQRCSSHDLPHVQKALPPAAKG